MNSSSLSILGGTFNPVHFGHLQIADSVRQAVGGRVLFIPAHIPVHKVPEVTAPADQRVAMIKIAVADLDYAIVDTCEISRGGRSYSVDTVDDIYRRYQFHDKPNLIIGDDLIDGFSTWKHVNELVKKVNLIVARRGSAEHVPFDYPHTYLANPIFHAASSEIRSCIRGGQCVDDWVPAGVLAYIERHRLYGQAVD